MGSKARLVETTKRPFVKRILSLKPRHNLWGVWSDFITMFACALSNRFDRVHFEKREAMYMKIIGKYDEQERMVFPELCVDVVQALEENSEQDFLGSVYMELELGNDHAGQFFTPYDVCRLMADIAGSNYASIVLKDGYCSINDCACGAGATLIAACHAAGKQLALFGRNWQNHILVTAQDIDFIVGMMCYIQLSLIGAAGYVKIGDSICDPMHADDSKENYWYTPMFFSSTWSWRRLLHQVNSMTGVDWPENKTATREKRESVERTQQEDD